MPHETPTTEPRFIRAGDSLQWIRSLSDFPAPAWTLKYVLLAPAYKIEVTSTADGSSHKVDLSSSVTSGYPPGNYTFTGYVDNAGGERHTLFRRMMEILPDLTSLETEDGRSYAVRTLEKVEMAITELSDKGLTSASINGNTWTRQDIGKLMGLRSRLKSEVELEHQADGIGSGGEIFGHFGNP